MPVHTKTLWESPTSCMYDIIKKTCSKTGATLFVGTRTGFMAMYGSDIKLTEERS